VVAYRSFRNGDPPQLLQLWHACGLGRGAAEGFTCDAFDLLVFSPQYFDPQGLIVAVDDQRQIIGFVHAGFGCDLSGGDIDLTAGVICMVMVHPQHRRQGIGCELIRRAEEYLRSRGTTEIQAGSAEPRDPFYLVLYGGAEPAGFLESDSLARPFLTALGYQPARERWIFHKDLTDPNEAVDFKVVMNRRQMQLALTDEPPLLSPWWVTRYGRLDSIRFVEVPRTGGAPVAEVTIFGLDLYAEKWQERPAALTGLFVAPELRGKGYAKTMLLDVFRRLREESITIAEIHCEGGDEPAVKLLKGVGCRQIDTGIIYRKPAV